MGHHVMKFKRRRGSWRVVTYGRAMRLDILAIRVASVMSPTRPNSTASNRFSRDGGGHGEAERHGQAHTRRHGGKPMVRAAVAYAMCLTAGMGAEVVIVTVLAIPISYGGSVLHVEIRHCVKPTSHGFNVGKMLCLRCHPHFSNTTHKRNCRSTWGSLSLCTTCASGGKRCWARSLSDSSQKPPESNKSVSVIVTPSASSKMIRPRRASPAGIVVARCHASSVRRSAGVRRIVKAVVRPRAIACPCV